MGALALAAGTLGGAWALMSSADDESGRTEHHRVVAATPETTSADGAASESTLAASSDPAAAHGRPATCLAEVVAGEAAVVAAHRSYVDWSLHVQAQLDFDSGATTRKQTAATWAETKSRGADDIAAFQEAYQAYQGVRGACAQPASTEGAESSDTGCVARAKALGVAADAGAKVNEDWAAHMEMMNNKQHIGASYGQMWRDMVAAAPTNLAPFENAYESLSSAPRCGGAD